MLCLTHATHAPRNALQARWFQILRCGFWLLLLSLAPWVQAQIRIGQTAGFSGPAAAGVKETTDGAKLYFDAVNRAGGVDGQMLELVSLDDKFEPPLAAENAKKLISQGVLALFLTRGTPHAQAILPLLAPAKIALVAPSSGAMVLHQPVHPWVFNVRTSYQREAVRAIRHLNLLGLERIALVQVDDSFGNDGAIGALRGFESVGRKPVLQEKFNREKPDLAPIVQKLLQTQAQAVLFLGSGAVVADGVKLLRAAGSKAQMVTLSNNASAGFIKLLGEHARGTMVTQVFPYERSLVNLMVKEARELLGAKGGGELTPAMVEGFAAAKVLVEGLKRAGKNPSREQLRDALESFNRVDIGNVELSFSPTDHSGLDYADLSIVGEDGRFRR